MMDEKNWEGVAIWCAENGVEVETMPWRRLQKHRHHYYEDENAISCECNDVILSFVETIYKLTIIDGRCLYNKLREEIFATTITSNSNQHTETTAANSSNRYLNWRMRSNTRRMTIQQNNEAFTPGFFLRHIEGENVSSYCFSPLNLTGIYAGNISYYIYHSNMYFRRVG